MPKHGKRYRAAREVIDPERVYSPIEAVRMIKDHELTRFDPTVEVALRPRGGFVMRIERTSPAGRRSMT